MSAATEAVLHERIEEVEYKLAQAVAERDRIEELLQRRELVVSQLPTDARFRAAKTVLAGLLADQQSTLELVRRSGNADQAAGEVLAGVAVRWADALIAELLKPTSELPGDLG